MPQQRAFGQAMVQRSYEETCLYGFALPGAVYSVLEQQAKAANCTCSELLQVILERAYPREISRQISVQGPAETNLISSAAYGQSYGKSQEQVKQYCHGNRLSPLVTASTTLPMTTGPPFGSVFWSTRCPLPMPAKR